MMVVLSGVAKTKQEKNVPLFFFLKGIGEIMRLPSSAASLSASSCIASVNLCLAISVLEEGGLFCLIASSILASNSSVSTLV